MAVYKSPGVYTRDVDYWIPLKSYSSFNRKIKINKIFNLEIDLYADLKSFNPNYRKTFIVPVGGSNNNTNAINKLKQYISSFKI
jgi:hypothetical protein